MYCSMKCAASPSSVTRAWLQLSTGSRYASIQRRNSFGVRISIVGFSQ